MKRNRFKSKQQLKNGSSVSPIYSNPVLGAHLLNNEKFILHSAKYYLGIFVM